MANPIAFAAGTTTASVNHTIKVTKLILETTGTVATSATVTDSGGNLLVPQFNNTGTTAGAQQIIDFQTPMIWPGTPNPNNFSTTAAASFVVTVAGAGGILYVYHR